MFSLDKNLCDIFPTDGNCLIIVWMITGPGQAHLFFKVLEDGCWGTWEFIGAPRATYKVSALTKAEIGMQGKEAVRLLRLVTAFSVTYKYRQMLASP